MVNPESSHVRIGWISVISVDFSVISVDISGYQLISVDISVISVNFSWYQLISVGYQFSLLWYHTAVRYQFSPLWYHTAVGYQFSLLWYHTAVGYQFSLLWYHTAVGYQFPPLWYHTLNLISPWIRLKSNLRIQGFNPCIKRKSHRKLVRFFLNHWNQQVGRCVLLNHHEWRECNDQNDQLKQLNHKGWQLDH